MAIALLALIGIFCALFARFKNGGKVWIFSVVIGAIAFAISLYPFLSVYQSAKKENVSLSLRQYISGFLPRDSKIRHSTRTFAEIDGQKLNVDIYLPPEEIEKNGAAIIVVHGGSWNAGTRSDFPEWNEWLAGQGFAVFDVDYRLAPQPNWKTATGDVKCAASWIRRNAAEFGISPDRIALMGRSAGGHLALLAAYSAGESRLPSSCSDGEAESFRAVVSFYAPTDLIWSYDNPANERVIDGPATLRRFIGGNPRESEEIKNDFLSASPTSYITAQTAPTLLVHGGRDQLVRAQNMDFLDAKLNESGVAHKLIYIPYAQHGFDYNFDGWGAQLIKPQLLEFLRDNTK